MKKLILSAACMMTAFFSFGQFNTVADAIPYTSGPDVGYVLNSTSCDNNLHACAIWNKTTLNFYRSFDIVFYANFTKTRSFGADGIVATFGSNINITTSVNNGGGYIGYYDIASGPFNPDFAKSLGVEYDIYPNGCAFNDPCGSVPFYDHIMVAANANYATALAGPVQTDPSVVNTKDGIFRKYRLQWDCDAHILYIYCKDTLRTQYSFDPALQFGSIANAQNVKWGFTSGIGNSCATDSIKNISVTLGTFCVPPCFDPNCHPYPTGFPTLPCTWQFMANGMCFSPDVIPVLYNWDFGDGSGDVYSPTVSVTHAFPASGPYAVRLKKIIVYNRVTGQCCELLIPIIYWVNVDCSGGGPVGKSTTIDPLKDGSSLAVYPNPANGLLNIRSTGIDIKTVRIYNMTGQRVTDKKCNGTGSEQVDVQALVNGSYIAEITDAQGESHKVTFVIQR